MDGENLVDLGIELDQKVSIWKDFWRVNIDAFSGHLFFFGVEQFDLKGRFDSSRGIGLIIFHDQIDALTTGKGLFVEQVGGAIDGSTLGIMLRDAIRQFADENAERGKSAGIVVGDGDDLLEESCLEIQCDGILEEVSWWMD